MGKLQSAVALLLALSASPADATCIQGNIAGTWTFYSVSESAYNDIGWIACTLLINSGGTFASGSSCETSHGLNSPARGSLTLKHAGNCSYQGTITFTSTGVVATISLATLALDKQSVSGVGLGLPGGTNGGFLLNMQRTN